MSGELQLQAGGTLNSRRHLYIERQEDEKFFQLLERGEYVNVLSSRQMGKSSLMMRAVQRLGERGIKSVTIDLASELGSPPDLNAFYLGLLSKIVRILALQIDLKVWWDERGAETVNQRLLRFFREVVGEAIAEPVVIFLDEIDSTLKLPYTDDLFTAIRGMYNDRPMVEAYRRITFCLLGVATPNELIKDRRTTAYNVGTPLTLRDFERAIDDLSPFSVVLDSDAEVANRLLDRILYWSGGQPYLTQKLCSDVVDNRIGDAGAVDNLVMNAFENLGQAGNDVHFQQILRFLEDRLSDETATIELYAKVLKGTAVPDRTTLANAELKLSGLVKRDNHGNLAVRNPIYRRLFDDVWVKGTGPRRALSRTRRYALAASIAFVLLLGGGAGYYINSVQPNQARLAALDRLAALKISLTDEGDGFKAKFPSGATAEVLKEAIPLLKRAGIIREIEAGSEPSDPTKADSVVGFTGEMNDLAPLSELSQLRSLDLAGLKVMDISPLAAFAELQTLRLGSARSASYMKEKLLLADITPIGRLTSLKDLSLNATSVSNIGPLSSLKNLTDLEIANTDVVDLRPLRNLSELRKLVASFSPIQRLDALSQLKFLRNLQLSATQVSDLSPLADLVNIRLLWLRDTKVTTIPALSKMVALKYLGLENTNVADLTPLSVLTDLDSLYLSDTPVSDVRPLAKLESLTTLWLSGTQVKDVDPLARLAKLITLGLGNTLVTDVRPLAGLVNLEYLSVTRIKVPREQLQLLRQNLKKARILSSDPSIPENPPNSLPPRRN